MVCLEVALIEWRRLGFIILPVFPAVAVVEEAHLALGELVDLLVHIDILVRLAVGAEVFLLILGRQGLPLLLEVAALLQSIAPIEVVLLADIGPKDAHAAQVDQPLDLGDVPVVLIEDASVPAVVAVAVAVVTGDASVVVQHADE